MVIPDEAVYCSTVIAFARAGMRDRMMDVMMQMNKERKRPTGSVYVWVLRCLINTGDITMANEVMRDIPRTDVYNHNRELSKLRNQVRLHFPHTEG